VDVTVTGADQLSQLARDLRAAGEKDLRRELLRGIQRAGKPLKAAARTAALTELPSRGGLAERVAGSRWAVKTRTAGRGVGVRVTGAGDLDLRSLNRGRLRHPLYGKRGHWFDQPVPPGWFDDAMQVAADEHVRDEILAAITAVRDKLGRTA
jgi:hypothetical protein